LSFDCFGEETLSGDFDNHILSGDYILLTYAATEWLEHVRQCAPHLSRLESLENLRGIISDFAAMRKNYLFEGRKEKRHTVETSFQMFEVSPDVYDMLTGMDTFLRKMRLGILDQSSKLFIRIIYDLFSLSSHVAVLIKCV
jgi:hypothetical protein